MKKYEPVDESTFLYFQDWQLAVGGVLVAVVIGAGLVANWLIPGSAVIVIPLVVAVIIVALLVGLVSWLYNYFKGDRS